ECRRHLVLDERIELLLECRRLVANRRRIERRFTDRRCDERLHLIDDEPGIVLWCRVALLQSLAQVAYLGVDVSRQRAPPCERLLARLVGAHRLNGHEIAELHLPAVDELTDRPELAPAHATGRGPFERLANN